ncbi:AI-2E family transporter [soil metagenome]
MNIADAESSFVKKVLVATAIVVLTLLAATLLYFTLDVLLLLFSAILIAVFLRSLAMPISRKLKLDETWSVLLVSIVMILVLAGAISVLAPSVAEQGRKLRTELPRSGAQIAEFASQYSLGREVIAQLPTVDEVMQKADPGSLMASVGGVFSSTVGAVGNFFIVLLLAIYLAIEPQLYINGFSRLFPKERRPRVKEIFAKMGETLRWWIVGKIGLMIFIGLLTWLGLSIIGVPLALTLGLIAGLLSFIPNFGPILSAIPAILLAFINSPITALYVIGLYVGVQIIESNLVTPLIERRTVELPPALTVVSQIALGVTLGALGLVLATPLLAVVMVVVTMVYVEDILGDDTEFGDIESEPVAAESE